MLEVAAGTRSRHREASLQLIPGGSARSVLSTPFTVRPAASPGEPATLEARAMLAAVPPGRYTASAAVMIDGQPLTRDQPGHRDHRGARRPRQCRTCGAAGGTPPCRRTAAAPPANAPAGSPDEIMRRVGAYVEQYGGQASLLVGVEHYSQSVTHSWSRRWRPEWRQRDGRQRAGRDDRQWADGRAERRRLVSEFALVPNASTSGGWLGYRDVIEMNGKPVADRRDRLQALFRSDAPDLEEARRIVDEGARYNIGPVSRNFNVPTTTLFFFHTGNLSRFTFRRKGRERIDDVDTRRDRLPRRAEPDADHEWRRARTCLRRGRSG